MSIEQQPTYEKRQISPEGLKKYEEELNYLKVEKRAEIAQKIQDSREQGDLSENAEYDAAKDEKEILKLVLLKLNIY